MEASPSGFQLRSADRRCVVQDLSLQVCEVDYIVVDDAYLPYSGCREIEGEGRAQTAGADEKNPSSLEPLLPLQAHLGDEKVAAVAA